MSQAGRELDIQAFRIDREPFYAEVRGEVGLFTIAARSKMPVMLKGPTGCGKTRFIEHMAWRLRKPLITVACHEDMTASDLVGRYLLDSEGTVWHDGPLTLAVRHGAICYLDEIVEARQDTTVVIHPLTDDRRIRMALPTIRAIIDRGLQLPESTTIGYDREQDLANGHHITESGIVVVITRSTMPIAPCWTKAFTRKRPMPEGAV